MKRVYGINVCTTFRIEQSVNNIRYEGVYPSSKKGIRIKESVIGNIGNEYTPQYINKINLPKEIKEKIEGDSVIIYTHGEKDLKIISQYSPHGDISIKV